MHNSKHPQYSEVVVDILSEGISSNVAVVAVDPVVFLF